MTGDRYSDRYSDRLDGRLDGRLGAWLVGGTVGALSTRITYAGLRRQPPGGMDLWQRTNHRGRTVTLVEGPAFVAGALAGVALTPGLSRRVKLAAAAAVVGAGLFGGYDDLMGGGTSKGFRGHLGALGRGEVTSGTVKLAGIGGSGLIAGALLSHGAVDKVLGGAVVAGAANLVNLLDLRPGRALKAGLLATGLLAGRGQGAAVVAPAAAAAALLPIDLDEEGMLGDCGANALGAVIGVAAVAGTARPQRIALLAGIVAATLASEKISFTNVIERTPVLHAFDMLGRRPAGP